jgi:hypothetical protein
MDFLERLRKKAANLVGSKQESSVELSGGKNVQLWDLREPEKAKERGVEPGYYFTANPISESELSDPLLLQKLSFFFHQGLNEAGLYEKSGIRIPIDTQNNMFVDPALAWKFSQTGYIPDLQMLVVRADKVGQDEAQGKIIKALRK